MRSWYDLDEKERKSIKKEFNSKRNEIPFVLSSIVIVIIFILSIIPLYYFFLETADEVLKNAYLIVFIASVFSSVMFTLCTVMKNIRKNSEFITWLDVSKSIRK